MFRREGWLNLEAVFQDRYLASISVIRTNCRYWCALISVVGNCIKDLCKDVFFQKI